MKLLSYHEKFRYFLNVTKLDKYGLNNLNYNPNFKKKISDHTFLVTFNQFYKISSYLSNRFRNVCRYVFLYIKEDTHVQKVLSVIIKIK